MDGLWLVVAVIVGGVVGYISGHLAGFSKGFGLARDVGCELLETVTIRWGKTEEDLMTVLDLKGK